MKCVVPWLGAARLSIGMAMAMAGAVHAHEVHERVQQNAPAVVVSLSYADGEPFSAEYYEVYADGSPKATVTGRTDAQGRIVFLPDGAKRWRVRSFSADGHGVEASFDAVAVSSATAVVSGPPSILDRAGRTLLGLSVLAICFLAVWRLLRRHKASDAHP